MPTNSTRFAAAFGLASALSIIGSATAATGFRQPDAKAHPELFVWTDTCNVYVLRDGDAALLIDLGDGSVLEHLDEIGVKTVEWVLFTHHHREQCQGIASVDREMTKIAAPSAARELFEKPSQFRKWFPNLGDQYTVHGASYVRPPQKPLLLDRALDAGTVFKWRTLEAECLGTPGHSPGGMSYLVRQNGASIAFTGGVMHDGAKMTSWYDSEWDYGFAKGIDTLIDSLGGLIERHPDLVLPSQGPPARDGATQLATYRKKLTAFRRSYVRGYPVFDMPSRDRDPISKPTASPAINQVTPHLFKLGHETHGKNFAIIVADSGKGLVLDCGLFPKLMLHKLIFDLRKHIGLKEIDAMWISHMHGDHFLLGPVLKEKYGAQMWTLDRIADKIEHPRRYDYAALVYSYGDDGFDGMQIDKAFTDGETIEWEGYTIHVDWMPGQTEFGCCLWLDIDGKRIAFTGDNLFANSADKSQDGHECVVARNSALFEEGYLYGSQYLQALKPDIVMGSHSYVMPEPAALLGRYHEWSKEIITLYQDLLPDADYEYGFDPYWVSAYPYRVDLSGRDTQTVTVTVRNFRSTPQRHRVELKLPAGVTANPAVLDGLVAPESRRGFKVELTVDREVAQPGLQIVPLDITLDGKRYGELFDFLIRAQQE